MAGEPRADAPGGVPGDWYAGTLPRNLVLEPEVSLESTYGFAAFASERSPGLVMRRASGTYDGTSFIVGPGGAVTVGEYTVLNGTSVVCERDVRIGAHCLLAWGVVVTDSWHPAAVPLAVRQAALRAAARDPHRRIPALAEPEPVVVEDNVWVGFDAVIMPGVRVGRGAVVGCRTVVTADVPPYAVLAGAPARIVRRLAATDGQAARERALRDYARPAPG